MAPRASWKGYLKLSLVSCPIALYPAASSSERVSFNRINKKTGNRLKQQLVDAVRTPLGEYPLRHWIGVAYHGAPCDERIGADHVAEASKQMEVFGQEVLPRFREKQAKRSTTAVS
jgi:hypothetical protein